MHKPPIKTPPEDLLLGDLPLKALAAGDFAQAALHFSLGQLEQAAEICRAILAITPRRALALHLLGVITAERGQPAEGLRLVERALALDHRNPAFHFSHGRLLMRCGNPVAAVTALKECMQLDAGNPRIPRHLVLALLECRRLSEADAVTRAALGTWPLSGELQDALGMVLMARGLPEEARMVLERARELAPDYPDTYGNLAILYEQSNHLDAALEVIVHGLRRWPQHRTLHFIRGRCLRRRGRYAEAKLGLQQLLQGELTHKLHLDIEYELGWCADGMDDTADAFQHFTQANRLAEKLPSYSQAQGAEYLRMLATLQQQFDRGWISTWRDLPAIEKTKDPVFIIGFPRSGTTLLDTMLGAHTEFSVLEEQPTVQAMLERLATYTGGYPAGLANLSMEQLHALRAAYFQMTPPGKHQLLDKSPFNTVHVGLIHKVFPEALLIFVARHPCDVCLSCFMNNFEMNSGTQHFTRLETTVRLYCQVMALWLTYVETLPLHYQMLRYEDLVQQSEKELRRLLEGIGVPWSDDVLQHTTYALNRGHIPTPSYAQVHRPLYHDACYRWRRYADFLQPFLNDLQPYIETFGYAI